MGDEYWALEMPNGLTYVGRRFQDKSNGNQLSLEEVVSMPTEPMIRWVEGGPKTRDVISSYRSNYRRALKELKAVELGSYHGFSDDYSDLRMVVMKYYLGEDILKD